MSIFWTQVSDINEIAMEKGFKKRMKQDFCFLICYETSNHDIVFNTENTVVYTFKEQPLDGKMMEMREKKINTQLNA